MLLGLGCLCEPQSVFDQHVWMSCVTVKKKGKKLFWLQSMLGFWLLILVKPVWHLLKWPICPSRAASCAIQWALNLADQHLCVGVYVRGQYLHMHPCICDYSVCMCECARACGQKYRSVHPALPPSVLRQATGHFIHTHPLHIQYSHIALFVFVYLLLL